MPNPDDFIFHSDWLSFQNYEEYTFSLATPGSVASGDVGRTASSYQDTGNDQPFFSVFTSWNGTPFVFPSGKYAQNPISVDYNDATLPGPITGIGYSVYPSVEVNGSSIRAVLHIPNPYGANMTTPSKTFNFTVRVYIPPVGVL